MKDDTSLLLTPMLNEKFGEVFNSNDIDAVMECFAPEQTAR